MERWREDGEGGGWLVLLELGVGFFKKVPKEMNDDD